MRTVKEVADLTGISTRTLQYYDEIGVLNPTKVNESGYRFYDDVALERLQQIRFFKELDFRLKDIKEIMDNPNYNKLEMYKKQKELLILKRDRLNNLITLLEKLEKGEAKMSFKEFDMSGYIVELEAFKLKNTQSIIKHWGSMEKFDEFIQQIKTNEEQVAKIAIKQFGSIEKYTEAMKYNMEHFDEIMSRVEVVKENKEQVLQRTDDLYKKLTADMTKPVDSEEIQEFVKQIVEETRQNTAGVDMGEGFWNMVIEAYSDKTIKRINDEKYGEGASEYIAEALRAYF